MTKIISMTQNNVYYAPKMLVDDIVQNLSFSLRKWFLDLEQRYVNGYYTDTTLWLCFKSDVDFVDTMLDYKEDYVPNADNYKDLGFKDAYEYLENYFKLSSREYPNSVYSFKGLISLLDRVLSEKVKDELESKVEKEINCFKKNNTTELSQDYVKKYTEVLEYYVAPISVVEFDRERLTYKVEVWIKFEIY